MEKNDGDLLRRSAPVFGVTHQNTSALMRLLIPQSQTPDMESGHASEDFGDEAMREVAALLGNSSFRRSFGTMTRDTEYVSFKEQCDLKSPVIDVTDCDSASSIDIGHSETSHPTVLEVASSDQAKVDHLIQLKSTVPATVFNCANLLIGVGVLALPFGFRQCGWLLGLSLMTIPALISAYTAKLLIRCMRVCPSASSYDDIADHAFGRIGRNIVNLIFSLELIATNVALIILFSDSVNVLFPFLGKLEWKIMIGIGLIPLNFASLRHLSITSAGGIFLFIAILTTLIAAGTSQEASPGSLKHVAHTSLLPSSAVAVFASLGIFMAPWSGHSLVPVVYTDMQEPKKFGKALKWTYMITFSIGLSIGVISYLMFGDSVLTEVTTNILTLESYPVELQHVVLVIVALIPVVKIALINRPIMKMIHQRLTAFSEEESFSGPNDAQKPWWSNRHTVARRLVSGILANVIELVIAILFPNFDNVVGLMGSALCITICVILPSCFYLRLITYGGTEVSPQKGNVLAVWALVIVGSVCAVAGTFATIVETRGRAAIGQAGQHL